MNCSKLTWATPRSCATQLESIAGSVVDELLRSQTGLGHSFAQPVYRAATILRSDKRVNRVYRVYWPTGVAAKTTAPIMASLNGGTRTANLTITP